MWKRALAVLLIVLMLSGNIAFIGECDIAAAAADTDVGMTLEQAHQFVAEYENKADNINFDEYLTEYFAEPSLISLINSGMDDKTIAPGYIEDLKGNIAFNAAYAVWEGKNLIANPGDSMQKLLNRELYYETVLLKLLDAFVDKNTAVDWLENGVLNYCMDFGQILADSDLVGYTFNRNNALYFSTLTDSQKSILLKNAKKYAEKSLPQIYGNDLTFVDSIFDAATTVEQFIERICSYIRVSELSDIMCDFLKKMKENTNNELLKSAVDTVLAVTADSFYTMLLQKSALTVTGASLNMFFANNWKKIVAQKLNLGVLSSGFIIVNAVWLAFAVGQSISNICFSTDERLDHYELMKALVEVEYAAKNTVSELLEENESGEMISTGVDFLYRVYAMDCDLCIDLVNISDDDWIKFSSSAEREQIKTDITIVKNYFSDQYGKIIPANGDCGTDLNWIYNKFTKELLIYGSGAMSAYKIGKAPWYAYRDSIKTVYVSSMCTEIGDYAFYELTAVSSPIVFASAEIFNIYCFGGMNCSTSLIFCKSARIDYFFDAPIDIDSIYAFGDLCIRGGEVIVRNLEIEAEFSTDLNPSVYISEGGTMSASSVNAASPGLLELREGATADIYGNFYLEGYINRDRILMMKAGSRLNIYGSCDILGGVCTVEKTAGIYVSQNCFLSTRFFLYGNMTVDGILYVLSGIRNDAVLRVYGTMYIGAYNARLDWIDGAFFNGVTCIDGSMYIKDSFYTHNLDNLLMNGRKSYLSVKGDAMYLYLCTPDYVEKPDGEDEDISISRTYGTIELSGDADFDGGELGNISLILSGGNKQKISCTEGLNVGKIIINNGRGVTFSDGIIVNELFDHRFNPFTLEKGGEFPDYDGDGLTDESDPQPTVYTEAYQPDDDWANFEYTVSDSEITVTGYNGTKKDIVIPDEAAGFRITEISAGFDNENIESITVGKYVNDISSTSFNDAVNLKNIYVHPENEDYVSDDGVLLEIDRKTIVKYPRAKRADTYVVSETVTKIGAASFHAADVDEVILHDALKTIDLSGFEASEISAVRIPESVTSIGMGAFSGCSNLKTVFFDAKNCAAPSLNILGRYTFPSNVERVIFGNKVQKIPNYFMKAGKAAEIVIPASVTTIEAKAFYNFSSLTLAANADSCAKAYSESKGYTFVALACESCVCSDWQIERAAGCIKYGVKTGQCSGCGRTVTEVIPAIGHNIEQHTEKAPSCEEIGWNAYEECSGCGYTTYIEISATGHNFSASVTEATCLQLGFTAYTCRCGYSYEDNYTDISLHKDADLDGSCDTCLAGVIDDGEEVNCTHICHSKGIPGIFWKVINLINRFFRTNPVCECGAAHY